MRTLHCINRPVLLKTTDPNDLVVLLLGNQRETSQISLGAHQVAIVRDDDARRTLPDELKVITLYTIYYILYTMCTHTLQTINIHYQVCMHTTISFTIAVYVRIGAASVYI